MSETFSNTQADIERSIVVSPLPETLQSIDYRLAYVEAISNRIYIKLGVIERTQEMKPQHWVVTVLVLVVVYLIGVKFPSIGQSALSKIGL